MSPVQRYVSHELTHFVGGNVAAPDVQQREEERYDLLVKILKSGTLLALGDWQGDPSDRPWTRAVTWSPKAKQLSEMFTDSVVCFCDIPVDDLEIHMEKYSHFGLAFPKSWLLRQGANPVLYVAEDSIMPRGASRKEVYTEGVREGLELIDMLLGEEGQSEKPLQRRIFDHRLFVVQELFTLIKPFKAGLSEEDLTNYYMEREWRVPGDVKFDLAEVERIILPRGFAERLREDVPDYIGQVTFAD